MSDLTRTDLIKLIAIATKPLNLYGVNLYGVNLSNLCLKGAILTFANLQEANLEGVNLEGVNLEGANLKGANLYKANLEGVRGYKTMITEREIQAKGIKKLLLRVFSRYNSGAIIESND